MPSYDVIIAGAGPSGCASALELSNLDPDLAGRILVIDKAVFPRAKLCAGGLSADADSALAHLGVDLNVSAIPVHKTTLVLPTGSLTFEKTSQFRVVRREQFDYALLQSVRKRAITVNEGETVERITLRRDCVIVQTSKSEYQAQILIAADGANSTIRTKLGVSRRGRVMVAIELHVPIPEISIPKLTNNMAVLDLSLLTRGVPGYCWVFPAVPDSRLLSVGIFGASTNEDGTRIKEAFGSWLTTVGFDRQAFHAQSHPILRYVPKAACSLRRVLFVGDALGADPLFGEGISSALALGTIAAQSTLRALRDQDTSFSSYEKSVRSSSIGSMMRRRHMIARRLYSHPKLARLFLNKPTLLKGLSLLRAPISGATLTWEPLNQRFPYLSDAS
jgi:menaquinone-9 beta-reductase